MSNPELHIEREGVEITVAISYEYNPGQRERYSRHGWDPHIDPSVDVLEATIDEIHGNLPGFEVGDDIELTKDEKRLAESRVWGFIEAQVE